MKIKNLLLGIIAVIALSVESQGQDPHFSQYYANPLYLNPAMAGTQVCPRLIFNYRNQWPSISGTYVTYNASYDQHIDAISGGLGVLVNVDRAGEGRETRRQGADLPRGEGRAVAVGDCDCV